MAKLGIEFLTQPPERCSLLRALYRRRCPRVLPLVAPKRSLTLPLQELPPCRLHIDYWWYVSRPSDPRRGKPLPASIVGTLAKPPEPRLSALSPLFNPMKLLGSDMRLKVLTRRRPRHLSLYILSFSLTSRSTAPMPSQTPSALTHPKQCILRGTSLPAQYTTKPVVCIWLIVLWGILLSMTVPLAVLYRAILL